MSFFDAKTTVVQIDSDNTVTIRALTYGEEQAIKQSAMKVSARISGRKGEDAEGEAVVDPAAMQRLTLQKAIVSWAGPGFDNRPVTIDNIDALPTFVLDPVIEAFNELTAPPLSEDEKNG